MFKTKLKDFMKKYPDQTILSFAWSLYWRLFVVIFTIAFIIGFISGLL